MKILDEFTGKSVEVAEETLLEDLGIDSISLTEFKSGLEQQLNIEIPKAGLTLDMSLARLKNTVEALANIPKLGLDCSLELRKSHDHKKERPTKVSEHKTELERKDINEALTNHKEIISPANVLHKAPQLFDEASSKYQPKGF